MATRETVPPHALERLRALVEERMRGGLKQKQVAAEIGCAPEHLSRVLSGKRAVTPDLLRDAAERIGFDPFYFEAEVAKSYQDFMHTPERVLQGELGTSRLGDALFAADALIGAGTDAEPEVAESLAHEVLKLAAVQTAWKIVTTRDPLERQALGASLAWQIRAWPKDPEVIARVADSSAKK